MATTIEKETEAAEGKSTTGSRYPGIVSTTDGSGAVVWVESQIAQGACAYPITPSTPMGDGFAVEFANGTKNLWGEPLVFLEPESEHSSASACEGFALAGGRVSNFTSGQGLILMKEVLYVISGKRLPVVFHIGARALTSHSLNVHAGHDDVMGVADVGWGILFARNAQEAADLAVIARRAAEDSETPFMNCQDGFLTTHTLETIRLPEPEFMKEFVGLLDQVFDRVGVGLHARFADVQDVALDLVHQRIDLALVIIDAADHLGADADHLPQQIFLLHDVEVIAEVGGGGDGVRERREVGNAADLFEELLILEPLLEGDHVNGFAFVIHLRQGGEDRLMAQVVEDFRPAFEFLDAFPHALVG